MEITFLSLDEVVAVHNEQIRRFGGSFGIRDHGLLEAAVNMPQATFGGQFLHEDLQSMAASYLFHLVANHPFIDGNKRVGAAPADVFLGMNGWRLTADQDTYADFVLDIAASRREKKDALEFFRCHAVQTPE